MNTQLILTVLCNDRPGIVEKIAETIHTHNGNWLESRLSRLGGKFAGIVQFETSAELKKNLISSLTALAELGIFIAVDEISDDKASVARADIEPPTNADQISSEASTKTYFFTIAGNDRPGIIREVSQAFSVRRINLEHLDSRCTSIPHVGTPLFEASGEISVPSNTDLDELEKHLDRISEELAIDIQLEESEF